MSTLPWLGWIPGNLASCQPTARNAARAEIYHRLGPLLQPPRSMQLDGLLKAELDKLDKLEFLRCHGVHAPDLSRLPAGRRWIYTATRSSACTTGRRSSAGSSEVDRPIMAVSSPAS